MKNAILCLSVVLGFTALSASSGALNSGESPTGRLLPVVIIKNRPKAQVLISLANPSNGVIRYAIDGAGGWYGVQGELRKEGKLVIEGKGPLTTPLPLQKDQLRVLNPGKSVVLAYHLPYLKIQPGKYELKLSYNIHAKSVLAIDFGLTPMKLEQTLLLDVRPE